MTTVETGRLVEAAQDPYAHLSYSEVIDAMQSVVLPGQTDLAEQDVRILGDLTEVLKAKAGEKALAEYDRYNGTKERRLDLPHCMLREQLQNKVILVTGGTGLIGSALLDIISQYGPARMVSISRGETPTMKEVVGVEYLEADIRDTEKINRIVTEVKPDIIYHVAADKYNAEAEKRARHTLTTNIWGVENIIEAAEAAGTPLVVQASTGKATRPYSPDIYASSKKTGEMLMAQAAAEGKFVGAAARFTHVVDDSNVRRKVNEQIDAGQPVRLQSPDVMMYIQSAYESAQLLLISGLEAVPNEYRVQAINYLDMPINLTNIGLGAIMKRQANVPIYFQGVTEGYEDVAWPHLYDISNGDLSPLINAIETFNAGAADTCPEVDSFVLEIAETDEINFALNALKNAFDQNSEGTSLRELNQELAWAMLDARIAKLPTEVLERICRQIERMPAEHYASNPEEFGRTNQAFLHALEARRTERPASA